MSTNVSAFLRYFKENIWNFIFHLKSKTNLLTFRQFNSHTDRDEKPLFSDSGDHETWTFVKKTAGLILHKYNTFLYIMKV